MSDLLDEIWELHSRAEDALLAGQSQEYLAGLKNKAESLLEQAVMSNKPIGKVTRVIEPYESQNSGVVEVRMDPLPTQWPRPIPVSERLPAIVNKLDGEPYSDFVLAYAQRGMGWYTGTYNEAGEWEIEVDDCGEITHWLPLPPAPEET